MTARFRGVSLIACVAASLFGCASAVRFPTRDVEQPGLIRGYVSMPTGAGPFPGVVLLHGGTGVERNHHEWATFLASSGYVALVVDSQRRTGVPGPDTMMRDGLGGRDYLRSLPQVAGDRVAVMGFSRGGAAALDSVSPSRGEFSTGTGFRAAVVLYPLCSHLRLDTAVPVLLLLGRNDTVTRPDECVETGLQLQRGGRSPIRWVIYPNAHHAFDNADAIGIVRYLHGTVAFDPEATAQARREVEAFLRQHLGSRPAPARRGRPLPRPTP